VLSENNKFGDDTDFWKISGFNHACMSVNSFLPGYLCGMIDISNPMLLIHIELGRNTSSYYESQNPKQKMFTKIYTGANLTNNLRP
jgi:hypothetical protein